MVITLIAMIHVLAGAAWFGAMYYSLFLLQPRAQAYFSKPTEYETFITAVSHGARWKVIAGLTVVAVTGLALLVLVMRPLLPLSWWLVVAGKIGLFVLASGLFWHISWRFWPGRVFALEEEIPRLQRRARRLGLLMLCLAGAMMGLGVLAARLW